jgi:DNA modification methylase
MAVRKAGWKQPERMVWYKKDGGMGGAVERPRRNFEDVLWFSKSTKPFVNLTACGKRTSRKGMTNKNPRGNFHTDGGVLVDGIARVPDVITVGDVDLVVEAPVGGIDHGIKHPAMFPPELVRTLILTFAPVGSVILDPFVGSGTTCLVAQALGYDYLGIDKKRAYVALAEQRLKTARAPLV